MGVIARRIASVPRRTSTETWKAICDLVEPAASASRTELDSATGVAAMLIAEEYTRQEPIVFAGSGPQLRIYTLHGADAVEADPSLETSLSFSPVEGDWSASLPVGSVDFLFAQEALAAVSPRVTVRCID